MTAPVASVTTSIRCPVAEVFEPFVEPRFVLDRHPDARVPGYPV